MLTFGDVSAIFLPLPSGNDRKSQESKRNKQLKVLGIAGEQNLSSSHAFYVIQNQSISLF